MRKIVVPLTILFCSTFIFSGCKKTDEFQSADLQDYLNLGIGKFITYRLDSTVFSNFGQTTTTISYQAKDEIDGSITDNLGRPAWRVIRYLRDTAGLNAWVPNSSFMIVPTREVVETVVENFRYQSLHLPIKNDYTWKGNAFISLYSNDPNWDYRYLDDWDYTYENVEEPFTVFNNQVINNTITVNQRDEVIGIASDPNSYSEKNFSMEVYGLGIGLIYKDFLHWEYQPPNAGNPGYKIGYGIRLRMISHN